MESGVISRSRDRPVRSRATNGPYYLRSPARIARAGLFDAHPPVQAQRKQDRVRLVAPFRVGLHAQPTEVERVPECLSGARGVLLNAVLDVHDESGDLLDGGNARDVSLTDADRSLLGFGRTKLARGARTVSNAPGLAARSVELMKETRRSTSPCFFETCGWSCRDSSPDSFLKLFRRSAIVVIILSRKLVSPFDRAADRRQQNDGGDDHEQRAQHERGEGPARQPPGAVPEANHERDEAAPPS